MFDDEKAIGESVPVDAVDPEDTEEDTEEEEEEEEEE
jgi:hypothetical protein